MKTVGKFALGVALSFMLIAGAQAESNVSAGATTTTNANSGSQASNAGVQMSNTWNTPGDTDSHIHYSGFTGSNTAVGLGSFSSSFSPDYCGGVSQTGISAPYVTIAHGEPKAGKVGVWCDDQRTSVHAMEFAATYGNAAIKAFDLAAQAEKNKDESAHQMFIESAKYYAAMSKKLSTFAVYMQCGHSDQSLKMARAAGIDCPLTDAERSAMSNEEATKVRQEAVARGEPLDPFVRSREGLPPLEKVASK